MIIRNASTTVLSAALLLSLAACGTVNRGVRHLKGLKDPSTPEQPFQLQAQSIPGYYVADNNNNFHVYKFSAHTVEVFAPADKADNCGEARPYGVVGNTIEIQASEHCKAGETLTVSKFEYSDNMEVNAGTPSYNVLRRVDPIVLTHHVTDWDTAGAPIAPGLKPFFVVEASAATIDAQRSDLRAALENAHIVLKKSALYRSYTETTSGLVTHVTGYKNGAMFSVTALTQADNPSTTDGPVCFVFSREVLPLGDSSPLEGFNEKITTVTLLSSRKDKGTWTLSNHDGAAATVAETANFERYNRIKIDLAPTVKTPAGYDGKAPTEIAALTLSCAKAAGPEVLTLADIQAAVGANLVISK